MLSCWEGLASERPFEQHPKATKGVVVYIPVRGAIPWQAIDAWARRQGLGNAEFCVLEAVIQYLDVERAERISSELEVP